jgi:16S rRNA (adenine1518-N6/adenine1519-N6)-dimethyltransferase
VEIVRHPSPLDENINAQQLFSLVKMGFAKRRKMLRGAMAGRVMPEQFEQAGISPTARAEELSVHDWIRLAHVMKASE